MLRSLTRLVTKGAGIGRLQTMSPSTIGCAESVVQRQPREELDARRSPRLPELLGAQQGSGTSEERPVSR